MRSHLRQNHPKIIGFKLFLYKKEETLIQKNRVSEMVETSPFSLRIALHGHWLSVSVIEFSIEGMALSNSRIEAKCTPHSGMYQVQTTSCGVISQQKAYQSTYFEIFLNAMPVSVVETPLAEITPACIILCVCMEPEVVKKAIYHCVLAFFSYTPQLRQNIYH